jgi:hypothetical protein
MHSAVNKFPDGLGCSKVHVHYLGALNHGGTCMVKFIGVSHLT